MGRIYSISHQGALTTAADLLELSPADDKPVKLRGMAICQVTEVGDTQEESVRIQILRLPATVTGGSGGSAITPKPMDSADAAAGVAAECLNTTVATTSSTADVLAELGWNVRGTPWEFWFPDERFAPKAKQGEALVVRLQAAPADSITFGVTFWIEEE